jgi:uncharacterized RDD family membrane protein YckC
MSNLYINTTQNIRLFFTTATIGERMLAYGVDLLIKIAYIVILLLIFTKLLNIDITHKLEEPVMVLYLLLVLPLMFYSLICESTMEGQTFGKKLLKIKVVKIDGYQAGFLDYFIRWIFALVDIQMGFIPGVISMVSTKHTRRIGDLAAGTAVISEKSRYNISHTILLDLAEDYQPHFQRNQVMLFSDNDIRIIKENAAIASREKNMILSSKLSQKIESVMMISNPFSTEKQLIETLLKDYNFYTGK